MKHIHHLKARWLLTAMVVAVIVGEIAGKAACSALNVRFPAFAVGALCVGLVAAGVSVIYDGRD